MSTSNPQTDGLSGIGPRVDAYGTHARAGALADYLEVQALLGQRRTAADLADIAVEQTWSRLRRRTVIVETDDPEEDPAAWSEMAFAAIDERLDILGANYPFEVERGALAYAGPPDPTEDPYISVLCLAVAHAWSLPTEVEPTVVMEEITARTLAGRALPSADLGTGDRRGIGFVANLKEQGEALGLRPSQNPVPRFAAAKDAGVDTLAAIHWGDQRTGVWTFIGQVTCAGSTMWSRKLKEPDTGRWQSYLQEKLRPIAFLSVPHHIDERMWAILMASEYGLLLDRLRICQFKGANSDDEKALVRAVLRARPE